MKKLLAIIFGILILSPVFAFAKTNYPDPKGYVNDFAGVLSKDTVTQLNTQLKDYEARTTNQISIVFIKSLNGDTIENYSIGLAEKWKVGQKGKDNGVIFLAAVQDRKMRIEVGYGLEGALTDLQAKNIISNIVSPDFKRGDYNQGAKDAADAIIKTIGGENAAGNAPKPAFADIFGGIMNLLGGAFWIILFVPIWIISLLARSKSWYAGGILGAVIGIIVAIATFNWLNLLFFGVPFGILGLVIDYFVSKNYQKYKDAGQTIPWWLGGSGGSGSGGDGGFGGFGGGDFGGGGASGDW